MSEQAVVVPYMGLRRQDYQRAMDVQCACNLSGVVKSFSDVMARIWAEARSNPAAGGTDWVNKHPIARLYAEQVSNLSGAGMGDHDSYGVAYKACEEAIASGTLPE